MALDFSNTNSLWASVLAETLFRLGLQTAIICPGSRSTPLTFAFARHPNIEALPILDERSAAFFALGCAKRQHRPVALVCTSGTAGANFYPAVIEAYESGIPLILFTADRPPELRDCASGQTIDQQKLYGGFVTHYSELAVPVATKPMLAYLRQTLVSAWSRSLSPIPGPIHFNCPFRDPLPPIAEEKNGEHLTASDFNEQNFFSAIIPPASVTQQVSLPVSTWQQSTKGVIIAGPATASDPEAYCQAVGALSRSLNWPVLAEALSPLRHYRSLNPLLMSTYDVALRNAQVAQTLAPEHIIQLGPLPTSKVLRQWLQSTPHQRWIVGSARNLDPLHGHTQLIPSTVQSLAQMLRLADDTAAPDCNAIYCQQWLTQEKQTRQRLDKSLIEETALVESKIIWLLSQHLPKSVPLFISNSMPVRDAEYFWPLNDRHTQPVFSRGANGIDGTLSTAMGLAHRNRPTVLLTGDLAFLHDTNGLLNAPQLAGHLTIVLINNGGGGIFEMLPVAQFEPEFEKYFVTPQAVDFAAMCTTYGIAYELVETVENFIDCVESLPVSGMRLLEVRCVGAASLIENRKQSVRQRRVLLQGSVNKDA